MFRISFIFFQESEADMLERNFQAGLIKDIKDRLPGCIVLKNDPNYIQGIPDLSVYYGDKWAFLEVKASSKSKRQANQEYYIQYAEENAFGAIVCPENKEEVLNELQCALQPRRKTRVSRSKQIPLA